MRFHALWPETPVAIGRADSCRITLEDTEVSRLHARLRFSEGQWHVEDCGSTNGVLVNGRRQPATRLHGGEVVRVGAIFFRYLAQGTASADCVHEVSEDGLVGGPSLAGVRRRLLSVADSDLTVLLSGATGTGKEVASRFLHQSGSRRHAPFVAVNCAAIPEEIFESVLFGHVRGAFSGAAADALGFFRAADGGDAVPGRDRRAQPPLPGEAPARAPGQRRPAGRHAAGGRRRRPGRLRREHRPARPDRGGDVSRRSLRPRRRDRAGAAVAGGARRGHPAPRPALRPQARWAGARAGGRHRRSPVRGALAAQRAAARERGAPRPARSRAGVHPPAAALRGPRRRLLGGVPRAPRPPATSPLEALPRRHHGDVARVAAELGLSRSQLYRRAARDGLRPAAYRKR